MKASENKNKLTETVFNYISFRNCRLAGDGRACRANFRINNAKLITLRTCASAYMRAYTSSAGIMFFVKINAI